MTTDELKAEQPPTKPHKGPLAGALALLLKGAALAAAVAAVPFAILATVPDANDYADAVVLKHRQLARDEPRKIVLVGGSNLAYGVDSARIQKATGCDVANMGMNGYLGVRYMLNEVKPHLKPADVVVIALEYDSYFKSVDGVSNDQLAIVKADPRTLAYLTWKQRLLVLKAVPFVAQQKVLRLMRESVGNIKRVLGRADATSDMDRITDIESLRGFTSQGDLVSHLGVKWPSVRERGVDMDATPADREVIDLLQGFVAEMNARGVKVLISFTPVEREYYDRYRAHIDGLYTLMADKRAMPVPSRPADFVFDDSMMFDTVYHLNARGRVVRTDRLVADLDRQFGDRAKCAAPTQLTQNGKSLPHE